MLNAEVLTLICSGVLSLTFICQGVLGQSQKGVVTTENKELSEAHEMDYPQLRRQAGLFADAGVRGDFATVVDFSYPQIVERQGGRKKMIAGLIDGANWRKKDGNRYTSVKVSEPEQIESVGDRIFALLTLVVDVVRGNQEFLLETPLIGISNDGGKNWRFLEPFDQTVFRMMFPDAADRFKIPSHRTSARPVSKVS